MPEPDVAPSNGVPMHARGKGSPGLRGAPVGGAAVQKNIGLVAQRSSCLGASEMQHSRVEKSATSSSDIRRHCDGCSRTMKSRCDQSPRKDYNIGVRRLTNSSPRRRSQCGSFQETAEVIAGRLQDVLGVAEVGAANKCLQLTENHWLNSRAGGINWYSTLAITTRRARDGTDACRVHVDQRYVVGRWWAHYCCVCSRPRPFDGVSETRTCVNARAAHARSH